MFKGSHKLQSSKYTGGGYGLTDCKVVREGRVSHVACLKGLTNCNVVRTQVEGTVSQAVK